MKRITVVPIDTSGPGSPGDFGAMVEAVVPFDTNAFVVWAARDGDHEAVRYLQKALGAWTDPDTRIVPSSQWLFREQWVQDDVREAVRGAVLRDLAIRTADEKLLPVAPPVLLWLHCTGGIINWDDTTRADSPPNRLPAIEEGTPIGERDRVLLWGEQMAVSYL